MKLETEVVRKQITVRGIVQGVGFRPYVYGLATGLGLAGSVLNDPSGVTIEVEGESATVESFFSRLRADPPPLARIDEMDARYLQPKGDTDFRILQSESAGQHTALISPDMSVCDECLSEIRDPRARRHRYAFTNCTNCGPRFTITKDIPYDRPNTTMGGFSMCRECRIEYEDPGDRRFHAQPIACPVCGPQLRLTNPLGAALEGDPLESAARLLVRGRILALKGLGGFHLACDALNEEAVSSLRSRKHREEKPFALMAADIESIRRYCHVSGEQEGLLKGRRKPIVLLKRLSEEQRTSEAGAAEPGSLERGPGEASLAPSVAPGNRNLGFMLPYTPLHFLLLDEFTRAGGRGILVMTSGNVSDEPIAYTDRAALEDLVGIADYLLMHDRPIHIRCDDSVVRTFGGSEMLLRRARGYAPEPVRLPLKSLRPVLAVGAELKHTFCLAEQDRAFVSHHIGDLENWETMKSFLEGVEHFSRIFQIAPAALAHDLHPEYLSTKWALAQAEGSEAPLPGADLAGAPAIAVQHHHAHIASCLADNGTSGPVIGLALDGTGYGDDGTIWGCEIMVADLVSYRRAGHLRTVPLAGGAAAIKEPWRMAAVYLAEAYGDRAGELALPFVRNTVSRWRPVLQMAASGLNSLPTSSAGRLFDAVAAVAGLKERVNYEGQAAIELEQTADPGGGRAYPCSVKAPSPGAPLVLDGVELFCAACEDLVQGASVSQVAGAFHRGLASGLVAACREVREATGISEVALSGGTFQNEMLLGLVAGGLDKIGLRVLTHSQVPANDGGISLGQAAVAAARMAKEG